MLKKGKQEISGEPARQKPLRLWPGVIIVILQWLIRYGIPVVLPGALVFGVAGGLLGGLAILVWWAFFSRAHWAERWGALLLMIISLALTPRIIHESIAVAGQGMLFYVYAVPLLCLVFVAWAVASRHLSDRSRQVTMVVTILLGCGVWALIRTGGITDGLNSDFAFRWTASPEEQLLAQSGDELTGAQPVPGLPETEPEWPGFRGPNRDGIIPGVRIETDWSSSPPVELWRRPVGPGWSSFAVHGSLFFTQEQRGENESVSCYNMTTGEPVWRHSDAARFWESNGGAGPRGTPTLSGGRVYSLGGTGIMNVLSAVDGSVVWSRNAASDTDTKVPIWGFSGSPLVVDSIVIAAVAGSLIAYDLTTGEPRWIKPADGDCYSSPHLVHIDGIEQVLLQNVSGAISVSPVDGTQLWEHSWAGTPIVQPAITVDGDILISVDDRNGVRRIAVTQGSDGWKVEERWASASLKPYFNDSVIHKSHVYGFDGPRLACIDINDGTRKWKGGRYGRGQFILLAGQDLLLVLSEKGKLALVEAVPGKFTELAKLPAIKGKTWNHPVLTGDILLVRNSSEMAAFRLELERR